MFLLLPSCNVDNNNSPIIFSATYDAGSAKSNIQLHEDGTYTWNNGSGLGIFTRQGKYQLSDSIIALDDGDFDKVIQTKRLLIRREKVDWKDDTAATFVYQIDDQNKIMERADRLVSTFDNRKTTKNAMK